MSIQGNVLNNVAYKIGQFCLKADQADIVVQNLLQNTWTIFPFSIIPQHWDHAADWDPSSHKTMAW